MKIFSETDIQDSEGRVVISPGLKVRHKESQYEYTVDSVTKDDDGSHVVVLNLPENPRFEPSSPEEEMISDLTKKDVIYEVDPSLVVYEPEEQGEEEPGVDFLAVPEKEFEYEYEVK